MNKQKIFKVSVILLALSFITQVATVICMVFLQKTMLKLGILETIFEAHEYNGFLLVSLVAVHIWLNWGWVRANLIGKK